MAGALIATHFGQHRHDITHVINLALGTDAFHRDLGRRLMAGQFKVQGARAVFLRGDLTAQGSLGYASLGTDLDHPGNIGAGAVVELRGDQ